MEELVARNGGRPHGRHGAAGDCQESTPRTRPSCIPAVQQAAAPRITAHPTEVDDIVKKAWEPVYGGQDRPHTHIVADFLAKYKDYLFYGDEYVVESITGDRLLREFRNSSATAASWDQSEHRSGLSCLCWLPTGWQCSST